MIKVCRAWTKERVRREIRKMVSQLGFVPNWEEAKKERYDLVMAAYRLFGGWRLAVEATGFEYPHNKKWRIKALRQKKPEEIKKEIIRKADSTHKEGVLALLKEKGLREDPEMEEVLRRKGILAKPQLRFCKRCGKPIFSPRIYCDLCRVEAAKESARRRIQRWLAKPGNRELLRARVKARYWQKRVEELTKEKR